MNLVVGDKPAEAVIKIDKLIVDAAFNPAEIVCSEIRRALKVNPEVLADSTSLVLTVEIGKFH
ncbi:hypothetical protein LAV_00072 [Sphingobium phage Lacusarx]|uniref:Uncharacterized protein n=1 Tax=Sphingobium phage Lacusarx TaxID=1980139 RepID=A0A1W6DXH6_9CAUD|nr:hypothetical protein FDH44_gp072 [Sphingobium phage Lacusarx]ARK07472.1 hypothetical protein LAV_00072 [Sphingobium phage Lacusarx]